MTIDILRHSSSVEPENPEGHVDACLRSGDQLPPSVSNVKGGQAAGAVWNFLSALGTPQQWRPTFVRLLGGLAWIARGNANEASPRQLTDASTTAAEDVDELKQDCGSREPSFEGQGALLLLPGPDPNPHHDLQPAPYPTFPGSRHFHRASAPALSLRGVPTVHAHPACGLRAFSSCSPLSVEGCLSYGSLSETLDGPHADGEDTYSATAAHGAYPPGWRTKPLLALCWYEHKEHAANGNSNGSDAAHAAAKDVEERHAAVSAAPANDRAAVPAAPITVPTLAHKPHHGGVPHAHNRLHGHAHAVHPPAPPASCHFVPQRVEMGLATDMGARNAMEDFAFAVPLKAHGAHMEHLQRGSSSDSNTQARAAHVPFTHAVCFGVFDGHGGAEVAESLAAHVPSGIQGRAEHIAVHGPQHVGAILADQERRLRARRHTHHHHHHGHSHQSRSHHVTHAALHAQRHHHGGEPGEHHRRVDASHSTHRRTHSPASSRSPDRRANPKGPTSAVQAVAMATAAAAQLQAAHIGSAGGAQSSHGGHGLATSPERRSHLAPPSHIAPPPTLGELGPADGAAAANGGAAPAAGTLELAGSTGSAISLGSECSSSTYHRSSTGGEPQSQVPSSTAAAASAVPSVHRPVPTALGVPPHTLAAYDLAASPRSECGELGSSCLSDMAGSLSDGPTSSLLGGEGAAGTPHLDGRDPGSTALVAVVIDGAMHVANVGDCRLVLGELVEGGRVIARRVTCDHAPAHHPGEAERLARLQVPVSKDGYVGDYMDLGGGLLQISRSIGDFSTKQQLQDRAGAAVVLSDPELHTVTLGPNTLFAVAVSDGVTCRLTDDTIISQVCKFLNESVVAGKPGGSGTAAAPGAGGVPMPAVKRTNNPQYAAQELVKYAVEVMASPDNAAAVVVSFTTEPPPVPQRPRLFTPRSRSCAAVATPSASAADVAVAVAAVVAPTCAP